MADSLWNELKRRNVVKVGIGYLVLAWVVIQVTQAAVPALHLPEWVNSLVFYLGAIGFPFALFFAWAFEITPEGVKREHEVDRSQSIRNETGRKIDFIIIGLLAIAVLFLLFDRSVEPNNNINQSDIASSSQNNAANSNKTLTSDAIAKASIAVLPFVNMSADPEQEYFSDGITEELLNVLAKVDALLVASRTSSFQFKNSTSSIPKIAEALKVRYVVEGSVRKSGDTIRITAQLIDTTNDRHLWSETYDRPLSVDNIFKIQDEITQQIVDALAAELGFFETQNIEVAQSTNNLSAYERFLKARSFFQSRKKLDQVEQLLLTAVTDDPNFADAWAIRAANYILMHEYGFTQIPNVELVKQSKVFANKALELDPRSATALASIGLGAFNLSLESRHKTNWHEIIDAFSQALAIEPKNPQALNWMGLALYMLGDYQQAIDYMLQCIEVEPYYQPCLVNHYSILPLIESDTAAMTAYLEALKVGAVSSDFAPFNSIVRLELKTLFMTMTNHQQMLFGWRRHEELYQALRKPEQNHTALLQDLRAFLAAHPDRSAYQLELLLIPLGHFDIDNTQAILWDPLMIGLRRSPEFKQQIKASGIYDYWLKNGFPEQCKPIGKDDFSCE